MSNIVFNDTSLSAYKLDFCDYDFKHEQPEHPFARISLSQQEIAEFDADDEDYDMTQEQISCVNYLQPIVIHRSIDDFASRDFVHFLLSSLCFDKHPFVLETFREIKSCFGQKRLEIRPTLTVSSKAKGILLVVLDGKSLDGKRAYTRFGEHQVAASLLASASNNWNFFHATDQTVYLIRVFNTSFTFFKATFSKKYLDQFHFYGPEQGLPSVKIEMCPSRDYQNTNILKRKFGFDFASVEGREQVVAHLEDIFKNINNK